MRSTSQRQRALRTLELDEAFLVEPAQEVGDEQRIAPRGPRSSSARVAASCTEQRNASVRSSAIAEVLSAGKRPPGREAART